jgi:hypothetical protein
MTVEEMYKSITGVDMPKPFAERTHEERVQAQNEFWMLLLSPTTTTA